MRPMWLAVLVVLAGGCFLVPEGREGSSHLQNHRPTVRIMTGSASLDSVTVDSKVSFFWRGVDEDGIVLRSQYAIDDTTTNGAWRDTTGFSVHLSLQATQPGDSASGLFHDWHRFYVRCFDNEGAASLPDSRVFNARTIAPTSWIVSPPLTNGVVPVLPPSVRIRWNGEDLDASSPDKVPAFFEIKLALLLDGFDSDAQVEDSLRVAKNLLLGEPGEPTFRGGCASPGA